MVATDTIVGIVGAVVLVGVMAGVFVYEYNNQPAGTDGGDGGDGSLGGAFSHLADDEDIDGDGIPNGEDPDVDGDGVENGNDTAVAFSDTFSATMAENVPPLIVGASPILDIFVGTGNSGVMVEAAYEATTPGQDTVSMQLEDGDGTVVAQASTSPAGAPGEETTLFLEVTESLEPGNYSIVFGYNGPSTPLDLDGAYTIDYATADQSD